MVVQYFLEGGDTGKGKHYIFFFPVFSNLQKFSQHHFFYYFCPCLGSLVCSCVMFLLTTCKLGLVFLSTLREKAAHLVFELKPVCHNNLIHNLFSFK